MHFLLLALGLMEAAVVSADQGVSNWSPGDPVITFVNTSTKNKAYDVETSSVAGPSAFKSCSGCITVGAGKTVIFHPGPWNGALTANHHQGTRHELNFLSPPGTTWYDDDMEYGMSDETLGPSDHRKKIGSSESAVSGEPDTLAKANAAWSHTDPGKKQALLNTGYLAGDMNRLTKVRMDKQAPGLVVDWLQIDADFNAYIGPGSVAGKSPSQADKIADKKSTFVETNKMTITIYE
ncbi:hypothetical protein MMC07_003971 [Pseudocyphellaria aurata]|nr:hypothetical protein [Pseudocyphellaria aurata]